MTRLMQDILKLSVSERILMVEAIWDSIAESEKQIDLNKETQKLLDKRWEAHEKNPEEGSSWDDVKTRLKSQF